MLNCPARSPLRASRRLPRGDRNTSSDVAASSISSFRAATFETERHRAGHMPSRKNRSVCSSAKPRITGRDICYVSRTVKAGFTGPPAYLLNMDRQLDRLFDPSVPIVTLDTFRRAVGRTLRIELVWSSSPCPHVAFGPPSVSMSRFAQANIATASARSESEKPALRKAAISAAPACGGVCASFAEKSAMRAGAAPALRRRRRRSDGR
jgi:hypothetical protein